MPAIETLTLSGEELENLRWCAHEALYEVVVDSESSSEPGGAIDHAVRILEHARVLRRLGTQITAEPIGLPEYECDVLADSLRYLCAMSDELAASGEEGNEYAVLYRNMSERARRGLAALEVQS